ncbi:hypothetical protein [Legionella longbeachae]|uniref:hypothetical protein n=1 Tax=Legionella longbeachae TaxID=450 RepID=UPI001C17897C|nr:hypothetical protein [Legionella pneumophila]
MHVPKIQRTIVDLVQALKEQIYFLKQSSQQYDKGHVNEAKRIANVIRILVHDTKNSKSILNQLELKDKSIFLDSAQSYNPNNLLTSACLVSMQFSNIGGTVEKRVIPLLNRTHGKGLINFDLWWNQIILDDKNRTYTRKDLILEMANTDGGAHIDPQLNEAYYNLTRNDSMKWLVFANNGTEYLRDFCLASIRQIGFEMCETLDSLDIERWRY